MTGWLRAQRLPVFCVWPLLSPVPFHGNLISWPAVYRFPEQTNGEMVLIAINITLQGFSWVKMGLRCSKKKCARCARSLCYHVTW